MERPVEKIKGVGPAKAAVLDSIGIRTAEDLLYYFPRRYVDRTLSENKIPVPGQNVTIMVRVQSKYLAHGKRSRLVVHCRTMHGEPISLLWFAGVQYFIRLFEQEQLLVVSGKLEYFSGLQIVHPDFEVIDEEDEKALIHVGRIIPIYPTTDAMKKKGLDSRGLRRILAELLDDSSLSIEETLPGALLRTRNLMERGEALRNMHYPADAESLDRARHRLKYEELFLFNVLMRKKREQRSALPRELWPIPFGKSKLYESLLGHLPFTLTEQQKSAIAELLEGGKSDHAEAYLLQGDVGSGKTVVALATALHYIENGIQTAILAPTEILARQHFRVIMDYLSLRENLRVELLTGQDKKKSRDLVVDGLANGDVDMVVGTHSLIEESVRFDSLGLVIVDEQHRFGVEQRESLRRKGKNPDLIAMTATPIPRSLCLTEFADLRLVTLKEKPAGRLPIKTMWLTEERRKGLYTSIRKHVSKGRQCYIVYPVIDESEKLDLRAASDAWEELSKVHFPEFRVELLHGRQKAPDRDRIMGEFRSGAIQILVTTTVIEVGVDVPNATIMVVEHADRFGISQLHQLRGRVGRGSEESFCVLMTSKEVTEDATERLKAVEESQDGFYLSEVDMRIRGPGELLGLKQHGVADFRLADLVADRELAELCNTDVSASEEPGEVALQWIRRHFSEGAVYFPG